jgi:ATP-dependent helicase/nuclease subunit A
MSENTRWTCEQMEAITENGCNLLVAAAAGAGKTAVLVERIIRKITDRENPVDIDNLLVVTFTNAAAAEMRERIADAISMCMEKEPAAGRIQRQLALLNKACITTIHSFCLDVIRSNIGSIELDPGFRIANETEAALMKLEAANELFDEQYEKEGNSDFFNLLECYGNNRDDQPLQDMVLSLYDFIQSSPWPEKWLDGVTESFSGDGKPDFAETVWGSVLLDSVIQELEGLRDMLAEAVEILNSAPGLEKYKTVFIEDLGSIDRLLRLVPQTWDSYYAAFRDYQFSRLPAAGKDADKAKQEYVKRIRDDVKAEIKKIKERVFAGNSDETFRDLKAMYPLMKSLAQLVKGFSAIYAAKKSKKSLVDFNDLEHFCLRILSEEGEDGSIRPSKSALGYRERFNEILVDEYQDSNMVQEIIINLISRDDSTSPNVFMVGDVKQSIYRFRQAKPELFLDKYNSYSVEKGSAHRKILLFKNFRSREQIIHSVNYIFSRIMSIKAGELDYDAGEALNPGAVFSDSTHTDSITGGRVELHIIQTGGNDASSFKEDSGIEEKDTAEGSEESEEMLDSIQSEASFAAKRIKELLMPDEQGRSFYIYDKGRKEYRKAEYRDIVILLRTTRNWSEVFLEELTACGIPAFADTGTGFFKTPEVQVAVSLLKIIDNPLQDIPLLSVLRSPIVSFTTGELAELRLADRKGTLFEALQALAESGEGALPQKAGTFLRDLQRWRDMSLYMSTDRLLWQLYNETGYYGLVGAMPAGQQRQANLRILFERARQFENTSYKGLFNFINFIDKLKVSRGDMGGAKILGENDNVVRIMSIHKSKGLEFPIVILSGCGKRFNMQDMNKSILIHQELGFGPDFVDISRRFSYPSPAKQAVREKIRAETLSEEMRILYVAMTRAREKLIITGTVNDISKALEKWTRPAGTAGGKLPVHYVLKGQSYMDWIGPALLKHKDGGVLRHIAGLGAGFEEFLAEDPSEWDIRLWNKSDLFNEKKAEKQQDSNFIKWLESLDTEDKNEFSDEIAKRLDWEYWYARISKVPAKVSVTELKRRLYTELSDEAGTFPEYLPVLVKKPRFLEGEKGISAAEAGTVMHFVMQHIDFRDPDIETQIKEMISKDLLTEKQALSVDIQRIRRFLKSRLGMRMLASDSINREVPFNIEIPCSELYRNIDDEECRSETLLLQGIIDCFFEDDDGIVLIDYKTDYVPAGGADSIRDRYRLQMEYYSRALEKLTGKRVKEKYIYLFYNGETLEF